MAAHLICVAIVWAALGAAHAAHAAEITDPTQPPAAARAPATTQAAAPTEAAEPAANRVQMIVRSGDARTAIVDGRPLRVGSALMIDGATAHVVRITEASVVLRHADRRLSTLELIPLGPRAVRCTRTHGTAALPCATAPELQR
jgi:hypothetical protein